MPNDADAPKWPDLRTVPVMIGVDAGSTTVEPAVIDPATRKIIWSVYQGYQTKPG